MPLVSKESTSRAGASRSRLLATAIISVIGYAYCCLNFWHYDKSVEERSTRQVNLTSGKNDLTTDCPTVYVLVHRRQKADLVKTGPGDVRPLSPLEISKLNDSQSSNAREFYFKFTKSSTTIPRIFWLQNPVDVPSQQEARTAFAVFYLPAHQKFELQTSFTPVLRGQNNQLSLAMLGAQVTPNFAWTGLSSVRSTRYLWPGHQFVQSDLFSDTDGKVGLSDSSLDLPTPIIGDGHGLTLTRIILPGERLRSDMIKLPKSEEELKQFLETRKVAYTEVAPVMPKANSKDSP